MRKPISKRKRFKIFERDEFTCMYCGRNPKEHKIALEVDHQVSVKHGGGNEIENLITSCFDCNRGKRGDSIIKGTELEDTKFELEKVKERLEQIQYISKLKNEIKQKENDIEEEIYYFIKDLMFRWEGQPIFNAINTRIRNHHKKYNYDIEFSEYSLRKTIEKFETKDSFGNDDFIKYFHGVLNKKFNNL